MLVNKKMPEFVAEGRSGYTVPAEDPDALARAVLAFYDAGGRDALAAGVKRQAALYSWDGLAEALLELTAEARERRARRAA